MIRTALELPPRPWTLPIVRQVLRELIAESWAARGPGEELEVAMNEACTNVVRHAGTTEPYHVLISLDTDRCRVEVADCGHGFDPDRVAADAAGTPPGYGRRGLLVMRALVDDLHIEPTTPVGMRITLVKHRDPPRHPPQLARLWDSLPAY
jgi:serine/threonine-protein kinase RsbW